MTAEWMDRDAIERGKRSMRRSTGDSRRHGDVVIVQSSRTAPMTLAERVEMHRVWSRLQDIDKDYRRGGFSPTMRHARG